MVLSTNQIDTFNAKTDLSQAQYLAVVRDTTTGFVSLPTAKHQIPVGIIVNQPSGVAEIGPTLADSSYNTNLNWTTTFEQISPVVCVGGICEMAVDAAYGIGQILMARGDGTYNGYGTAWDSSANGTGVFTLYKNPSSVPGDVVTVSFSNIIGG